MNPALLAAITVEESGSVSIREESPMTGLITEGAQRVALTSLQGTAKNSRWLAARLGLEEVPPALEELLRLARGYEPVQRDGRAGALSR